LQSKGATVFDVTLPNLDKFWESEFTVMLYEFKDGLNNYFQTRPGGTVKNLANLIAFNIEHKTDEMPFSGQEILEQAETMGPLTDTAYLDAVKNNRKYSRDEGIDKVMDENNLDALVAITCGPAFLIDHTNGDQFPGASSFPAAVAGYPNITVPAGFVTELPIGISFFGKAWTEPKLIKFAYAFEQASKARRIPQYKPTLKINESNIDLEF